MAISFIGQATGTTSVTIPTHQAGDLIVIAAFRDGSNTAPSLPAGWVNLGNPAGANTCSMRLAYRIATNGSTTSGTWTNATSVVCLVYRGVNQDFPIGDVAAASGSSTSVSYPALTMVNTGGSSWVAGFSGHRSTNTSLENAPTGMTNRANVNDATDEASGHDTNGGVASWSAQNVSVGGTSSGWQARTVEIVPAEFDPPTTWNHADLKDGYLSNGNLSFMTTAAVGAGVRATRSHSEGKRYFEVTANSPDTDNWYVGICNAGYAFDDDPAAFNSTALLFSDGTVWIGGSEVASGLGTTVNNDVIGIACDFDNGLIWFRRNTGNWNGSGTANPATGTGGISFASVTGPWFAWVGSDESADGGTGNFGASAFVNGPPSGFAPYWEEEEGGEVEGDFSAAGEAATAFVGAATATGTLTASAAAAVLFAGAAIAEGTSTSTGAATVSLAGAAEAAGELSAGGEASVAFVGDAEGGDTGTFTAAGSATVGFVGDFIYVPPVVPEPPVVSGGGGGGDRYAARRRYEDEEREAEERFWKGRPKAKQAKDKPSSAKSEVKKTVTKPEPIPDLVPVLTAALDEVEASRLAAEAAAEFAAQVAALEAAARALDEDTVTVLLLDTV